MKGRLSVSIPFKADLARWFSHKFEELPQNLQHLIERRLPIAWNDRTTKQRELAAETWDLQNPVKIDKARDQENDRAFRDGFKSVSVPRRNKRNAAKPRPTRQKVSNKAIMRAKADMEREGVRAHKQCFEAYRRLSPPITFRAFRKRWNLMAKKGT